MDLHCQICDNDTHNPKQCIKRPAVSEEDHTYYSARTVERVIAVASIIGATLFLEVAIVTLYVVTNDHIRFGLIAVFASLFAAALSVLTNACRVEMFAATAAYAAVLVVFLSGNLNNGKESGNG